MMKWRKMNMQYKSSTPMAWKLVLKPAFKALTLNDRVDKLLDEYEDGNDPRECEQAYSRALNLQKQSNKLLGISR